MEQLLKLSEEITQMTGEQAKRRLHAAQTTNEVYDLSRMTSAATQEQVRTAGLVLAEVATTNKRAEDISNLTTQQRERSQALQEIMQEMGRVALANAAGAQNSQQFSENLGKVMDEFSLLIAQFKIGSDAHLGGDGNGAGRSQQEESSPSEERKDLGQTREQA
jgi:methyl-accepting chemotaxis protein